MALAWKLAGSKHTRQRSLDLDFVGGDQICIMGQAKTPKKNTPECLGSSYLDVDFTNHVSFSGTDFKIIYLHISQKYH